MRPGGVDASHDPEVAAAMRTKKGVKRWEGVLLAVLGKCWPAMISPTGVLGRVVVELVVGDGEALRGGEGEGVSAGGRTVRNKAVRRMGGL